MYFDLPQAGTTRHIFENTNNNHTIVQRIDEETKIATSYDEAKDVLLTNTTETKNKNDEETINELFKEQIQKAKNVDDIKVVNKVK